MSATGPEVGERRSARGASLRLAAATLLVLAAGTACAGAAARSESGPPPGGATAPPARRANPADVQFISGMIHHHAQALVMAELARTHAESPSIRTLSQRIHVSQTDEIRMMQQWLAEVGEPVPELHVEGTHVMVHGADDAGLMPGMLTPEQMEQLQSARGAEFDRLFLTFMIQHHEGALEMVRSLFDAHGGGADDYIYKIASDTFADQGSEIDRMQRMLDSMPGPR